MTGWRSTALSTNPPSIAMGERETLPIGIDVAARLGQGESVSGSQPPTATLTRLDTHAEAGTLGTPGAMGTVITTPVSGLVRGVTYELEVAFSIGTRREVATLIIECVT